MPDTSDRIRSFRERLGLSPNKLAEALAISVNEYRDLENFDNEIVDCLSIRQLIRLSGLLQTTVEELLGVAPQDLPDSALSPDDLARLVRETLSSRKQLLCEFERAVGWDLGAFLAEPRSILEWNLEALQAVCKELGLHWVPFLWGVKSIVE